MISENHAAKKTNHTKMSPRHAVLLERRLGSCKKVIPQLGSYAEPGAKYYFDNGSNVDNMLKDKKLNFDFQFVLRCSIGKQYSQGRVVVGCHGFHVFGS